MWRMIESVLAMAVWCTDLGCVVDRLVAILVVAKRRDLIVRGVICIVLEEMMVSPKTIRSALTTMKVDKTCTYLP